MKIRNPKSRLDLRISKRDFVLDVGGGNDPHPRANVVVDKLLLDNTHRSGKLRLLKGQNFVLADGEKLPFKDKTFDYVICFHVNVKYLGAGLARLLGQSGYDTVAAMYQTIRGPFSKTQ